MAKPRIRTLVDDYVAVWVLVGYQRYFISKDAVTDAVIDIRAMMKAEVYRELMISGLEAGHIKPGVAFRLEHDRLETGVTSDEAYEWSLYRLEEIQEGSPYGKTKKTNSAKRTSRGETAKPHPQE